MQRRRPLKRLQIGLIAIVGATAFLVLPSSASASPDPFSDSLPPNSVFNGTHTGGGAVRLFADQKGYLVRIEVTDIPGTNLNTGDPCSFGLNRTYSTHVFISLHGEFESYGGTSGVNITGEFAGKFNGYWTTASGGYLYKDAGSDGCQAYGPSGSGLGWAASTLARPVSKQKCKKKKGKKSSTAATKKKCKKVKRG